VDLVEHHETLPHIRHVYMTTFITFLLFFVNLKSLGLAEIFHIRFQGCEPRAEICDLNLLFSAKIKHRQSKYLLQYVFRTFLAITFEKN
jgi:hypothetical protein